MYKLRASRVDNEQENRTDKSSKRQTFNIVIDTLARNLYIQEIPLGILTGFIGAPFFAWVLIKQKVVD